MTLSRHCSGGKFASGGKVQGRPLTIHEINFANAKRNAIKFGIGILTTGDNGNVSPEFIALASMCPTEALIVDSSCFFGHRIAVESACVYRLRPSNYLR